MWLENKDNSIYKGLWRMVQTRGEIWLSTPPKISETNHSETNIHFKASKTYFLFDVFID